jgi:hypothetical protein
MPEKNVGDLVISRKMVKLNKIKMISGRFRRSRKKAFPSSR